MSEVRKLQLIAVEDYLAGELDSPIKHEYLGGVVYVVPSERNMHHLIAANTIGSVGGRLRGKLCRPYNSDTKVRIQLPSQIRFYYPDVPVICQPNPPTDSYQDNPAAIFEVLSRRTRRIDEGEKKDAYLAIPSLGVYALLEQDEPTVIIHRALPAVLCARSIRGSRRSSLCQKSRSTCR